MRIPANLLLIAAALQIGAIGLLGGGSLMPLLLGAIVAGLVGLWLRRGGRAATWTGFLVASGGVIAAAGFAGGATGPAAGVFWAIVAATALAAILLLIALWTEAPPNRAA